MLPQSHTTLNTSLNTNLTPSSSHLKISSTIITNNLKIHDLIASFIYSSNIAHQSDRISSLPPSQLSSHEMECASVGTLCKRLHETGKKLIAGYIILYQTAKGSHQKHYKYSKTDGLLREVLFIGWQSLFRWRITEFLNYTATLLSDEHPQDLLQRLFYALWAASPNSPIKISLQSNLSIQRLLNTVISCSMVYEGQLFLDYVKNHLIASKDLEEKSYALKSKPFNRKCPFSELMKNQTATNLHCGFNDIEALNFEDESENHEEYSTTSGSSRAGNDCHLKAVAETLTVSNETCLNTLYELYDGCFFSDLTIQFSPEDKLFLPEDEFQEKTGIIPESSGYWEKDYYRYPKSYTHESPKRHNYTAYQPKHTEGGRKGAYYISYEPKYQKEQETEKDLLITKNTTSPAILSTASFPDVTNINVRETNTRPENKPKAKTSQPTRLTLEIPKPSHQGEKAHSGTSTRDKSWESLPNSAIGIGKQSKSSSNSSLLPNTARTHNTKNNDKVHSSKGEKVKKKAPKKEQDKGEIKLWDMINVKGKLKTF